MQDFEQDLMQLFEKQHPDSARNACNLFHGYYEKLVFGGGTLTENLSKVPTPYREIIAAHQAWGMISSDGFSNIFEDTNLDFDEYVKAGLELFGKGECFEPYSEARYLLEQRESELEARDDLDSLDDQELYDLTRLPDEEDDRLFDAFYGPIMNFDEMIGLFLLKRFN